MNQCYGCTTCKSADKPLEDLSVRSQWKLLITVWRVRVPNVALVFKVSVAVSALTGLAVSLRRLQEVSAAPTQTRSSPETF
mgnify:CR=1 FL=1